MRATVLIVLTLLVFSPFKKAMSQTEKKPQTVVLNHIAVYVADLKTATDFYIETKTRRLATNVKRLQDKADSLERSLNRKTYSTADVSRMLLDANPAYTTSGVTAEISSREKFMQSTIYAEIVKNLEMSKTALIQETPTVQVVDEPMLPLKNNHIHFLIAALVGAGVLALATGLIISTGKGN